MTVNLWPHQLKALEELSNGNILNGDVGSGKTITALAYWYVKVCGGTLPTEGSRDIGKPTKPRDIYVFTTARKRKDLDWQKEAIPFGVTTDRETSFTGATITVDSWNNIGKYENLKDAFIIADEQRLVGSGAWVKAFLKISKNNQWIMLSATPGDNYMDFLAVFIANGFFKNKTEFITRHVVYSRFSKFPKIERYMETGRLDKMRRAILVEMPFARHTIRHVVNTLVEYDQASFDKVYKNRWHIYEDRPIRDAGELYRVMRRLVNSDPSRLKQVKDIHKKHPRLIVFYSFNYELEALRSLSEQSIFPVAEWNGSKHEEVPKGEQWVYLVQYTAGSEGWNCTDTDATVFYSLPYSYKNYEQAQGRIDRLNTPYTDLYYYVLRSSSMIDAMIMKSLNLKKNFNEKEYIKPW